MADFTLNVKVNGIEQSVSTIGGLEQALAATNAELSKVEENSKEFNFLTNQANNLDKVVKALSQDAGSLNNSLSAVEKTSNELNSTFNTTAQAATQVGSQMTSAVSAAANSSQSLKTELREIVKELQLLEPGSAEFQRLSVRAGELKDQIADTNTVVTSLAGNTTERLGTALTGVVNIGVTGLQGVVGGMQLFGVESENAKAILEKLQGLLFFTQAIQGLGALPDSIAAIRAGLASLTTAREADLVVQQAQNAADTAQATTNTINTASQVANTVATEAHAAAAAADAAATTTATVATTGFTAALAANPIGLVVVGLTALISALVLFSGEEETAKSNIDETTNSLLAQNDVITQQEASFLSLYKLRREIEVLSIKDAKERAEAQKALDDELVERQTKNLDDELKRLKNNNANLLDEFGKYKDAYIGEREVLVREVAQYDEFGVFIGNLQEYETETFKIGQAVLTGLKGQKDTEIALIRADLAAKRISREEAQLLEEQAQTKFYIDYLTKQKEFLKQSEKADDENYKNNLDKLLQSFQKVRTALEKAYAERIKIAQEAEKKRLEEENKANEEAERKRQAALEKARADYKRAYDDIKKSITDKLKEANDLEKTFTDELTKSKFTTKQQEIDFEKLKEQEKLDALTKFRLEDIAKSKVLGKEKNKLAEQLQKETLQAQEALDKLYAEKKRLAEEETVKLAKERADKILVIQDILNKEISFGDQQTSDLFETLVIRENQLALEQLDFDNDINETKFKNYIKYLELRKDKQIEIIRAQNAVDLIEAEQEKNRNIANFTDLLDKEFGIEYKKTQEGKDLIAKFTENQDRLLATKRKEINQRARNEEEQAEKDTADSILSYKLQKLEEYAKLFGDISQTILNFATALTDSLKINEENRLLALKEANILRQNELNTSFNTELDLLNSQYESGLISQQQYNESSKKLEENRKDTIESLNRELEKKRIIAAQAAFDQEKKLKIAQAIISGLQGAVSAFTGAFQLGPIAGPIVGGILAALVTATTAVQISNIRKTKFDSTGLIDTVSANSIQSGGSSAAGAVANSALSSTGGFTSFTPQASGGGSGMAPNTGSATFTSAQRVYVLESDITSAQDRVRVLEGNSTFG